MPLDFPNSPTNGQTYSAGGKYWQYNGTQWVLVGVVPNLAVSGITDLGTNVGTFLTTPTSSNLASAVTGETGSGSVVFSASATLNSPTITGTITAGGGVGASGQSLQSTGTGIQWATVDALPSQTSNSGKYLTTNGTTASWATIVTDVMTDTKNAAILVMDIGV